MSRRRTGEGGSVSVFIVILTPAFFALFGLIVDGGLLLAAQQKATSVADAAARRGAQQIDEDGYRDTGHVSIDPSLAGASAREYFTAEGFTGEVQVRENVVEVSVRRPQDLPRLSLVGISSRTVKGVGTARLRGREDATS